MSTRPEAPATLNDVAKLAGVSLATASRVLNGSSRSVGADLADSVRRAAVSLNYSPNGPAQAMAKGHTTAIGMLAPDIADPFFTQVAAGATAAAGHRQMMLSLALHHGQPDREVAQIRAFRVQRARGLVIAGSRHRDEDGSSLVEAIGDLPAVLVGQPLAGLPAVGFDNVGAGRKLALQLAAIGYRQLVVLAGPRDHLTSADRVAGLTRGAQESGLGLEVVVGAFTRTGGLQLVEGLLDEDGLLARSDAARLRELVVVATTDMMALGAMTALHRSGRQPGADVAVAGFNDLPILADVRPGLTTVRFPLRQAGELAVQHLLGAELPAALLAGEVVIRDSTPPR